MGSHEGFVYNDELMRNQPFQLPTVEKEVHVYGTGSSYYRDMNELVRLLMGSGSPRIDESAVRIGEMIDSVQPDSYKNKNDFIMHSF